VCLIRTLSIINGCREKLKFRTKKQDEISSLESEIESLIWELVEERKRECSSEKDLMQLLLEAAMNDQCLGKDFSKQFIVDNCKNIYFAGHETTAVAASWSLMLLALYPEWQDRIRIEVAQHCPNGIPDADSLPLLKTVRHTQFDFVKNTHTHTYLYIVINTARDFIATKN